jgi:hypothetical protein
MGGNSSSVVVRVFFLNGLLLGLGNEEQSEVTGRTG